MLDKTAYLCITSYNKSKNKTQEYKNHTIII